MSALGRKPSEHPVGGLIIKVRSDDAIRPGARSDRGQSASPRPRQVGAGTCEVVR